MGFTLSTNAWCRNIVKGLKFKTVNVSGNGPVDFAIDKYGRAWSWGRSDDGCAGQGNYNYDSGAVPRQTVYENYMVVSPTLVALADGTVKDDWVKFNVGEYSCMGIDKDGALWGAGNTNSTSSWAPTEGNCASFGLPHDSGEDELEWDGTPARDNYQYNFFNFTRCAPGVTVKDFVHCYYYTLMIGEDDLLYFMGIDDGNGIAGQDDYASDFIAEVPTRINNVTDKIKLLGTTGGFNYDINGFVTQDNEVYLMGYGYFLDNAVSWDYPVIFDITFDLPDVDIVYMSVGYNAVIVTLANGDVYGLGPGYMLGDSSLGSTYNDASWYKIPISNIIYCEISQLGVFAIGSYGTLYSWGDAYYGTGNNVYDCESENYFTLLGIATSRRWKRVMYNHYNYNWVGIDQRGNLYAWGSQWWGPHLGLGTNYSTTLNGYGGIDAEPVEERCRPTLCDIPDISSVDFHWPRATHTPTPDYYDRS